MFTSLSFVLIIGIKKLLVKVFLDFFIFGDVERSKGVVVGDPCRPPPPVNNIPYIL
jgi:hypothetical protein